jgi:LmbE family N-acetylglucosaminyl deacetylase
MSANLPLDITTPPPNPPPVPLAESDSESQCACDTPVARTLDRPSSYSRYAGKTVLAIGAHPDDLEIGIGGMLAHLKRAGAHTVMAVASIPTDYEVRLAEAQRGAEILGADLRIMMEGGCRRIEDVKSYELVAMLDKLVRDYAPAAVVTHGSADFHRDHLLIHHACLPTQRLKFFDFYCFHPTQCRPVPVAFHPRVYIDVSNTIDVKMDAIMAHRSQFGGRSLPTDVYRDIARVQGRMVGVQYAEGLDVLRMMVG